MFKANDIEMPIIYSLRKKIKQDGRLCSKKLMNNNTWKQYKRVSDGKKVILYGAGEMFEYFCNVYFQQIHVEYAVDKNVLVQGGIEKNGIMVFPIEKLADEQEPYILLVTPVNGIDEIFFEMSARGVDKCFSFPVMEYHRISVKVKVWLLSMQKAKIQNYQLKWKINKLERKIENMEQRISGIQQRQTGMQQRLTGMQQRQTGMQQRLTEIQQRQTGIQQRQTERYLYLLHTNHVVNALIDKTDDIELKKEQMRYMFTEIYKNTYVPDLEHPRTYNEKILAMTLYDHNPLYTEVTDKYLFKQYVADKVGEEYVVPLLGVWDNPEDIDFSALPNQFVLKATGGGDGEKVILVKDKNELDIDETIKKMKVWNYKYENDYYRNFNWPFKNIKQRFIAEELLDTEGLPYYDFKVHCFHGEPKYVHVLCRDPHEATYFDLNWEPQKFIRTWPLIHFEVPKPECLDKMLDLSRKLSEPFKYVRVDFYVLKDKMYLGELTLTTLGGIIPFEPVEVDYEWGELI